MIGLKFATASGLLLKLGKYLKKYEVTKFECAAFSCFPEEKETLFFGGETVLKIKGALQWVGDVLMKYDRFMEPINAFSRMINGLPVKEQEIMNNTKSQRAMRVLIKDILRSLVLRRYESEAPKYIQDLILFHHGSSPRIRLSYGELLEDYQWLHCILKEEGSNNLNFANIALLFCHSDDVVFMMPDEYILSEAASGAMIKDLLMISKMALSVKISFVWTSEIPESLKTNLRNALLRLYGSDCVYHFDANSVSFMFEDAVIDGESQQAIQSRIESMIHRLNAASRSKQKKKNKETKQTPEQLKKQREYYRANDLANTIDFEDAQYFHHQLDPLGDLTVLLLDTDLLKQAPSAISIEIVRFVGYTESNLDELFWNPFFCSKLDVEQIYFISFCPNSRYPSYRLMSFQCDVLLNVAGECCATLMEWDREKVLKGKGEIVWQSEMRSRELENQKRSDKKTVDFEMNVKLDTDKIYLIKIDTPKGSTGCGSVRKSWDNHGKGCLVHAKARLYKNRYYMRSGYQSKRYEMLFTC